MSRSHPSFADGPRGNDRAAVHGGYLLEDELTLADPIETELSVWLSQTREGAAQRVGERTR